MSNQPDYSAFYEKRNELIGRLDKCIENLRNKYTGQAPNRATGSDLLRGIFGNRENASQLSSNVNINNQNAIQTHIDNLNAIQPDVRNTNDLTTKMQLLNQYETKVLNIESIVNNATGLDDLSVALKGGKKRKKGKTKKNRKQSRKRRH